MMKERDIISYDKLEKKRIENYNDLFKNNIKSMEINIEEAERENYNKIINKIVQVMDKPGYGQENIKKCKIKIKEIEIARDNVCNKKLFYPNQEKCANEIIDTFNDRTKIIVNVNALTQSGKTGCMLNFIYKYINQEPIPIKNIFITTGLHFNEWKEQQKERFPKCLHSNILKRDKIKKKIEKYKDEKNLLILIDEAHYAAKKKQTIDKILKSFECNKIEECYKKDIKIVLFTATPNRIIEDLKGFEHASNSLIMKPGDGYIGIKDLLEQGRILQYNKDVNDVTKDIEDKITEKFSKVSCYHIVRIPTGKKDTFEDDMKSWCKKNNYDCKSYDQNSGLKNINDVLSKQPTKHTFIFIKEKLRCSVTLKDEYIGIVYERKANKPVTSVVIQGLAGRLTGYNKNKETIIYTDLGVIDEYINSYESKFIDMYRCSERSSFVDNIATDDRREVPTDKKEYKYAYYICKPSKVNQFLRDNNLGEYREPKQDEKTGEYLANIYEKEPKRCTFEDIEPVIYRGLGTVKKRIYPFYTEKIGGELEFAIAYIVS